MSNQKDAKSPQVQINNLLKIYQNGNLDEVEKLATSLTKEFPKHEFGWKALGAVFKQTGRISESLVANQKSVQLAPKDAEAHNNLGITLKELGRLEEAEASHKQALALKPDSAQICYNLGTILKELGRLEEAEGIYRQTITLEPGFAEAHNNLGNALKGLGRLDEAEERYKQAIALKPDYADAHHNLGNALRELGRYDEAETSYIKAITFKPDYGKARNNFGVLLFARKKYNLAAEQFELSDHHQSKSHAIKCSYMLDKETIFYEKFSLLVNQGEINAVIGSVGVRSEIKYGIKKSNPFCNDPLKYVVKKDLNTLYDFENIFIKTTTDILKDDSVSYKAQGLLTNGIQTAGNIFSQGKVPKTEIESIIHAEIEKYRIQFKDSEEGFIKNWPASYEIEGWLVRMKSGGKLAPHMHDPGWLTGSIYINVPPKSKINSGNLVLCLNDQGGDLEMEKSQQSVIDIVSGDLCLFPSSLHHYTVPFEEKEDRIVLAFDVIPKS